MPDSFYRLTLRLHRDVVGTLYKMPREATEDAWKVLRGLEENPTPEASSLVEGLQDTYQIRTDGYRIVYEILEEENVVKILRLHLVE